MDKVLISKLEELKFRLANLVTEKESLIDPLVVAASQEMDDVIVRLQRSRMRKKLPAYALITLKSSLMIAASFIYI